MDGSSGTRAEKTREFAAWLEKACGLPVVLWDERLTTQQAVGIMHEQRVRSRDKRTVEHQISAALILQGYLDRAVSKVMFLKIVRTAFALACLVLFALLVLLAVSLYRPRTFTPGQRVVFEVEKGMGARRLSPGFLRTGGSSGPGCLS